ncbi:f-box domain-containing protein [Moniliophthora roreri MCA 2997]|uniref:F-box domain-containing protein n=1 Tax=Moniliophthora roreri (strain MCA 2997) TaxID=1381753 RepID=V2YGR9_MONRO|nr:f-box domain-containing protein [Moniliophthora roreri MCA 2997]
MSTKQLPQLPLDCLIHILSQLSASRDAEGESSIRTFANCSLTNSLFRQAATISRLWEPHYKVRYRQCNVENEEQRKDKLQENFWLMYGERRKLDRTALGYLDKIVADRVGRYEWAKELCRMNFEIWDVLDLEAEAMKGTLQYYSDEKPKPSITRYYWTRAILREITRCYAVRLWARIPEKEVSFVEGYSALSCFFGKLPDEMKTILDNLSAMARDFLLAAGCPLEPFHNKYDTKALCVKICDFLRESGFGPAEPLDFHDIHNQFPHCYLTSNRHTIPISLVHVFVAVARSVGIMASPVDFPVRVLAHVTEPADDKDDFYVDVFGSGQNAILSISEDIPRLLSRQGVAVNQMMDLISPCGPAPMLLRAGRNIMASLHSTQFSSADISHTSVILAFILHIQIGNRVDLIPQFISGCEPLDCATFVSEAMIPSHPEGLNYRNVLTSRIAELLEQEEKEASVIHYRSHEELSIQHFVGLLFRHRRYHYVGCIFGWDPVCAASEEWKREMDVNTLLRGENQPFYHCFCEDGSVRYVAEDNIQPVVNPANEIFDSFQASVKTLPKYFTGIHLRKSDNSSKGRFFLSPELEKAYPEDDAIGRAWVEQIL